MLACLSMLCTPSAHHQSPATASLAEAPPHCRHKVLSLVEPASLPCTDSESEGQSPCIFGGIRTLLSRATTSEPCSASSSTPQRGMPTSVGTDTCLPAPTDGGAIRLPIQGVHAGFAENQAACDWGLNEVLPGQTIASCLARQFVINCYYADTVLISSGQSSMSSSKHGEAHACIEST